MKYHVLFIYFYITNGASPVTQVVKNLTSMWETWVWSLGWEDPLEKEMATHSIILAWRIPWTEEPGGLQAPWGCKESDTAERLHMHNSIFMSFWGNSTLLSTGSSSFCTPPTLYKGSLFSTSLWKFIAFCFVFDNGHPNRLGMVPQCAFNSHFSDD